MCVYITNIHAHAHGNKNKYKILAWECYCVTFNNVPVTGNIELKLRSVKSNQQMSVDCSQRSSVFFPIYLHNPNYGGHCRTNSSGLEVAVKFSDRSPTAVDESAKLAVVW